MTQPPYDPPDDSRPGPDDGSTGGFPPPPPPGGGQPIGGYPPPGSAGGQYPPPPPPPPPPPTGFGGSGYGAPGLKPHRANLILVLGIVGLLCCSPVAIVAYVFGRKDLAEMDAGLMDSSGRSTTNVGRILGIVGIVFLILGLVYGATVVLASLGSS